MVCPACRSHGHYNVVWTLRDCLWSGTSPGTRDVPSEKCVNEEALSRTEPTA